MLVDLHPFRYTATVPWPDLNHTQIDWEQGISTVENWLLDNVGHRMLVWAWNDSGTNYQIGVSFRWEQHQTLFMLKWG